MNGPAFDPRLLLGGLGVSVVQSVTPVSGGWDLSIWRVEHGARTSALRVFRPEQALMARHEALVMRLAAANAPVPEIRAEGIWEDRPAMLLEWCAGRTVADELQARPMHAYRLGVQFGTVQAAIHAAPMGYDLNNLAGRWLLAAGPEEDGLRRRLRTLATPDVLLHLDYHPRNVMTDGERITGVLDWSNALPGDRRADLARTMSILRLMRGSVSSVVARIFERGWWAGYQQTAGRQRDLPAFYAWAGVLMQRDLAPRVGRPGTGLTEAHMVAVRTWTERWTRKAGVER